MLLFLATVYRFLPVFILWDERKEEKEAAEGGTNERIVFLENIQT